MNKPISVIIHTYNEKKNIRKCLECVKWADEIILIDMYSEDDTVDIAKEFGAKVFFFERMKYVEPAREFGLQQASNEWVLVVDADELVTLKLKNILEVLANDDRADIVFIPRINFLWGHPLKSGVAAPIRDAQMRFFKRNFIKSWPARVHSFPEIAPNARILRIPDPSCSFVHLTHVNAESLIEKINRYSTVQAEHDYNSGKKIAIDEVVYKTIEEINRGIFLSRSGETDGDLGLYYAIIGGMHEMLAGLKLQLMEKYKTACPSEKIEQVYAEIAQSLIKQYKDSSPQVGQENMMGDGSINGKSSL